MVSERVAKAMASVGESLFSAKSLLESSPEVSSKDND